MLVWYSSSVSASSTCLLSSPTYLLGSAPSLSLHVLLISSPLSSSPASPDLSHSITSPFLVSLIPLLSSSSLCVFMIEAEKTEEEAKNAAPEEELRIIFCFDSHKTCRYQWIGQPRAIRFS